MHRRSLALPLLALLLAACGSPVRTTYDTGPVTASTFSFVPRGDPAPSFADDRERMHALIQEAITRNLAARGVRRVPSGGDLIVAYLVVVGDRATTQAINDYFGYGRSYAALLEKAHHEYTQKDRPNLVRAGTLLIDLVDGHSLQVLKRTYATRPLLRDPSPEAREANVQSAVDEALADLRITQ